MSVVYRAIRSIFKGNQEFYLTYQGSSALFFEQSRSKHPYGVPYDIGYFHNDLGSLTVRVRLAFCVTPFNVAVASGIRWHVMETQGVGDLTMSHSSLAARATHLSHTSLHVNQENHRATLH